MKEVSFYNPQTGVLHDSHLLASDDRLVDLNTPAGHKSINGHHDHLSKRVDIATGVVVDYQPPQPSSDHEWNGETKRWQLTPAAIATAARRAGALARISALETSQTSVVRQLLLGDESARPRLQAIHDEISGLQAAI